MTLREYIAKYPERMDIPVAIFSEGRFDFLGAALVDYVLELEGDAEELGMKKGDKILIFSPN